MGFTFQINDNVEFNHNEVLLKKANKFTPKLNHQTVNLAAIGQLVEDKHKLSGYRIDSNQDLTGLEKSFKKGDRLILDFGDHYVGRFSVNIASVGSPMDAPLTLRLKFAEMPVELTQNSQDYQGWLSSSWMQEELIHLDVLPTELSLPRRYSFRYVEITVVDTSPKWQVVFSNPQIVAESSVANQETTLLKTTDKKLQQIYQVGQKTLQDCMQTVFEDGPKRDRRLWLGDLRLQALSNYATFKDNRLIKRCLYLFGAMTAKDGRIPANVFTVPQDTPDDTFLLDYGLFFISTLDDLMKVDEDREVLRDLYPVAKQQLDVILAKLTPTGELPFDEDYPVFVDWSNEFDKSTAGQAILIYTLKQFIHLTELMGAEVALYVKTLELVESFAKNTLFDQTAGLFTSGPKHEFNIASQVWMTLAHVLDDQQNHQLMLKTQATLFPAKGIATPYMYHHIVEALFQSNLKNDAINLMKHYWGKMIDLGADTFWEAFDPDDTNYSPYGSTMLNSYCHAWSCTPVYLIDRYLS